MDTLLIAWFGLLVVVVLLPVGAPRQGGALVLTYFLGMSLIHVPGAILYSGDRAMMANAQASVIGFDLSIKGLASLLLGACLQKMTRRSQRGIQCTEYILNPVGTLRAYQRLSLQMVITGFGAYFLLMPLASRIPSGTALMLPLSSLMVLGFWLRIYASERFADGKFTLSTLVATPLLPIATLVEQGIINYGMAWAIGVASFFYVMARRRIAIYLLAPVVGFLGLCLFVTYLGDRTGLRDVLWSNAGLEERFDRIGVTIRKFEFLDFNKPAQQDLINARLNQNYFVGVAVQRHQSGLTRFAYGGTLAPWALIPRALWRDKPDVGGGGGIVRQYTGLDLSDTTSWGAGQTLEFYANFGAIGVFIGFFCFGYLLMFLDGGLMEAIKGGDFRRILLYGLPAFSLIQWEGNLLEIMVRTVAAVVLSRSYFYFVRRTCLVPVARAV